MSVSMKHLATCGSVGRWGKRVGTSYAYTPQQVRAISGQPWFRFRNDECRSVCREEWAKPAPTESERFVVADESERPECGWATTLYSDDPLLKDPLVKWEGDGVRWGARCFSRIGDTDYFEWSECMPDFCWHRRGRLLKLKAAGQ